LIANIGVGELMTESNTAVTVSLPAPLGQIIVCPICEGNKCKVCKLSGKIHIEINGKIPIQRSHIVKYVVDNMAIISKEITRQYGLTPQINTKEVIQIENAEYEVVQISSIGGACWVVNRLDELDTPRYFTNYQELLKFKTTSMHE
tara:strand:+ start:3697 stop:4134 length:438 start_codon:yes stop_codon:yes gene_type:complete